MLILCELAHAEVFKIFGSPSRKASAPTPLNTIVTVSNPHKADFSLQTFMAALRALSRRGLAAVGAAGAASLAACEIKSDQVDHVEFKERSSENWIEVEQRRLADSLADFGSFQYAAALRNLRAAYGLGVPAMRAMQADFIGEANAGLAGEPSSMRMLPTFVNKRVTGDEKVKPTLLRRLARAAF